MIKARHTLTGRWLSDFCSGRYMNRYFRSVNLIGEGGGCEGKPLLILANHFSWWDGFIQYRLNKAVFGRKLHVMMLEQQLQKHMIMNRCGCFSVRKNSRSIIETMEYTRGLLSDPTNAVLIFPQGEIGSMHCGRVDFQSGVGYLLRNSPGEFRIIYNANLADYGPYKKPELNVYFKVADAIDYASLEVLSDGYNRFYGECLTEQRTVK